MEAAMAEARAKEKATAPTEASQKAGDNSLIAAVVAMVAPRCVAIIFTTLRLIGEYSSHRAPPTVQCYRADSRVCSCSPTLVR